MIEEGERAAWKWYMINKKGIHIFAVGSSREDMEAMQSRRGGKTQRISEVDEMEALGHGCKESCSMVRAANHSMHCQNAVQFRDGYL